LSGGDPLEQRASLKQDCLPTLVAQSLNCVAWPLRS
jgi:hypothetical protein